MTALDFPGRAPSTWTPAQRVARLLEEKAELGRILEFVSTANGRHVHVVAPDEDQPVHNDVVHALVQVLFRTVCGLRVALSLSSGGLVATFADDLLCPQCHDAFGDDAWHIFDDNTMDAWRAAGINNSIRRSKQDPTGEAVDDDQ